MDLTTIKKVLENTEYTMDDYYQVMSRMQDEKSKNILFYRVMIDNIDNPYYGLMLQKSSIEGDAFRDEVDRMMYQHLNFLLKNENYKKKIYCVGCTEYEIPRCDVWNSWNPLNVVSIFDNIEEKDEYLYDATGGKYIPVLAMNKIYDVDFQDSILIFTNSSYLSIRDELLLNHKIDVDDTFVFYTSTFCERNEQYFGESFIEFSENEVLIDGGAFNLDSCYDFDRQVHGLYHKIYSFEPIYEQYLECQKKLEEKPLHDVSLFNLGLSDCQKELRFENSGSASREDAFGDIVAQVDSIDHILEGERASIIKLDVEGSEYDAIVGAENTIKKYKPKLMICVYHKPNDILALTKLILSYCDDYVIYARHYSYTIYETVLYFIPK